MAYNFPMTQLTLVRFNKSLNVLQVSILGDCYLIKRGKRICLHTMFYEWHSCDVTEEQYQYIKFRFLYAILYQVYQVIFPFKTLFRCHYCEPIV